MPMSPQADDDEHTVIPTGGAAPRSASPASPAPTGSAASTGSTGSTGSTASTGSPVTSSTGGGSSHDSFSLPIGTRLDEFELTRKIGDGGFSIVYLAWDHTLDRHVALKEYMPSSLSVRHADMRVTARSENHRETFEAGMKSFINEAKLLASFDHPSLVKVFRFWQGNGTAYMAMPFYEGVNLRDTVRAMGQPPDEEWLLEMLDSVTEALAVIHAERCYHRDIAPDNVMMLAATGRPLLLDFGAARRVIGDMTQALTVILKPGYAPIEQYAEAPGMKQGPWTDVYALAAVVYWAVSGKTPPPSVGRIMNDSCVPLAEQAAGRYSEAFLEVIDRALAVRPEERTQNIDALREELGLAPVVIASKAAAAPVDPDATVIRTRGTSTGGTSARRGGTAATAKTAGTQPKTQPKTQAKTQPKSQPKTLPKTQPKTQPKTFAKTQPATRAQVSQVQADGITSDADSAGEPGRQRRFVWLGAAGAAAIAVAAAGWWLFVRSPPKPLPEPAAVVAPVLRAPASAVVPPPAIAPPVATPSVVAPPVVTPPVVTPPVAERPPETPPRAAAAPSAPVAAVIASAPPPRVDPPEPKPARAAPGTEPARPKPAPVAKANAAECARLLQRMSLGEGGNEVADRFKQLGCR